jgi:hypothetical protein
MSIKLVTVNVYAYINPVNVHPVNVTATWYKEGKILPTESDYRTVTALKGGYKVRYSVQVYKFRKVPDTQKELNKLFDMIRQNEKKTYSGWLHHANIYEKTPNQKQGRYLHQIILNYEL